MKCYDGPKGLLTDRALIVAEKDRTWLSGGLSKEAEFASNTAFVYDNAQKAWGASASGTLEWDIPSSLESSLTGGYSLRFKMAIETGTGAQNPYAAIIWRIGNRRIRLSFTENSIQKTGDSRIYTGNTEARTWYDYVLQMRPDDKADLYQRKDTVNGEWVKVLSDLTWQDETYTSRLRLDNTGAYMAIKELTIYRAMSAKLDDVSFDGSNVTVEGSVFYDTGFAEFNRRLELIAVAYDSRYGYTKAVDSYDMIIEGGIDTTLNQTLSLSGIEMEDKWSVMAWDSQSTAIALSDAKGTANLNKADDTVKGENIPAGMNVDTEYNEVYIKTALGADKANANVAITIENSSGTVVALMQVKANKYGVVDTMIAIDPFNYTYGDYTVNLACNEDLYTETVALYGTGTSPDITDENTFASFLNIYEDNEVKTLLADAVKGEIIKSEVYNELKNEVFDPSKIYEYRDKIKNAVKTANDEADLVSAVNVAAADGKWSDLEKLILTTYSSHLSTPQLTINSGYVSGVRSVKDMFLRMVYKTYTSGDDILAELASARSAQLSYEAANPPITSSNTGGGGGGGGAFIPGTVKPAEDGKTTDNNIGQQPIVTPTEFTDLDSVDWAADSINNLRKLNIVSGDANGNFNPNNNITREEFLKIVIGITGMELDSSAANTFEDVDVNQWYFPYISTAFNRSIVNGISDVHFGIGNNITRADMAVMLKRALDSLGIVVEPKKPAFVYDDFYKIPEYAREAIAYFSEAELMNGVGNNTFSPDGLATRAEAAVAAYRVYEYIENLKN